MLQKISFLVSLAALSLAGTALVVALEGSGRMELARPAPVQRLRASPSTCVWLRASCEDQNPEGCRAHVELGCELPAAP